MIRKYKKVGVGGTFDQLHKGHIKLISKALELGSLVIIGLTTDKLVNSFPKNHFIAKYDDRRKELTRFLSNLGVLKRVHIVPLDDAYGPATSDKNLEALILSYETAFRGEEINEIRRKKGFKPLKLVTINLVLAEDGLPISTTRIRKGDIDHEGHLLSGETLS